jgi:hypothetical protein
MPVAVLLISFVFGLKQPSGVLIAIVMSISLGVATASYGEVDFEMTGFIAQVMAIAFESSRLVMVQVLLQGLKMDPLVSLHYFAPVCAAINFVLLICWEGFEPFLELRRVGPLVLFTNAGVAFGLNITAVFLSKFAIEWIKDVRVVTDSSMTLVPLPLQSVLPLLWSLPCQESSRIFFSSLEVSFSLAPSSHPFSISGTRLL